MLHAVAEIASWWAASLVIWLITVQAADAIEIVLAVTASLACALFARKVRMVLNFQFAPIGSGSGREQRRALQWRWVLRLPRALVNDLVAAVLFIVRTLRGRAPDDRRHEAHWPAGDSAEAMAWRASAAIVVSATPATLVLDVDPDSGTALLHTLLPSRPKLDEMVTP